MSANCFSFWGTSSPDFLSELCPWTPLGDFPQTLWATAPQMKIPRAACQRHSALDTTRYLLQKQQSSNSR